MKKMNQNLIPESISGIKELEDFFRVYYCIIECLERNGFSEDVLSSFSFKKREERMYFVIDTEETDKARNVRRMLRTEYGIPLDNPYTLMLKNG